MYKPFIGITTGKSTSEDQITGYFLGEKYTQAITLAGGNPIIIPANFPIDQITELFSKLDGLLFPGGGDIDPNIFGGVPHPRVYEIDSERDALEIAFVKLASTSGLPFLGICRGAQIINVALGGTLYTDIADQATNPLKHDFFPDNPRDYLAHPIKIAHPSVLAKMTHKDTMNVNSLHHQAIRVTAPNLKEVAFASDGLVEAVELKQHPFGLGVQWHPEWLITQSENMAIFSTFIESCNQTGKAD
ncbi:MAG: gamma-glutamyl-gamma-aminobutyrate hydrolase family protein [Anaerolineaceae bacterium]